MKPRVAVLGATGAVGTLVCQLLDSRNFPFESIRFFGSPSSPEGRTLCFRGESHVVEPLVKEAIRNIDLAIGSTPDDAAAECAPWIVEQGGVFVDESACHRMLDAVPLVIPEVNAAAIREHQGIVASPNCSTTQLVVCLKPILEQFGIRRVVVSTYQAASGAGNAARRELLEGTTHLLQGQGKPPSEFEVSLPMNLWPKIGRMLDDGSCSEESKMIRETRKLLDVADLPICVTCVRVPVENCHSETVVVETERPVDPHALSELFSESAGITVVDNPGQLELPTPRNCHDRDGVYVGRIRRDPSVENGVAFWCVSDNLRKGAATNAVQIAELLVNA